MDLFSYQHPCPSYYYRVLHVDEAVAVLCPSWDLYRPFFRDGDDDCYSLLCPASSSLSLLEKGGETMAHNVTSRAADHCLLVLQDHGRVDPFLYLFHQDDPSCCLSPLCPCLDFVVA
jgi:hypothetical protein